MSTLLAWKRAQDLLPELLTTDEQAVIAMFYRESSGDNCERSLSYQLTDRMTFGFALGLIEDRKGFLELLNLLARGQREARERQLEQVRRNAEPKAKLPKELEGIKLDLKL